MTFYGSASLEKPRTENVEEEVAQAESALVNFFCQAGGHERTEMTIEVGSQIKVTSMDVSCSSSILQCSFCIGLIKQFPQAKICGFFLHQLLSKNLTEIPLENP